MRIGIVAVGKIKDRGARDWLDDYLARIARFTKVREVELREGDPAQTAERFEKAIANRAKVIALEVDGKSWSSHQLADFIGKGEVGSVPEADFLIGGSYGLPPAVTARAAIKLSLSKMTLPHRLARVMLAEQIYRAYTILRNQPYSH